MTWLSFFFRTSPKIKPIDNQKLTVSVVVAARNEALHLEVLLQALSGQKYHDFEIVVVNDRSTDQSASLLDSWQQKIDKLRVINLQDKPDALDGKKNALTQGIHAARGAVILLTDADCVPASTDWIEGMTKPFQDHNIQIVLGFSPYKYLPTWLNVFIQYETLYTAAQYWLACAWGIPYMGVGRNLAYRKSFFEQKQGFSAWQHLKGGDDDLFVGQHAQAHNTLCVAEPAYHTLSEPETSYSAWRSQKYRHLSAGKRYLFKHKLRLGLWQLSQWAMLGGISIMPFWIEEHPAIGWFLGFRYLCFTLGLWLLAKRLKINLSIFLIFLFEFVYFLYYFVNLFEILRKQPVKWK